MVKFYEFNVEVHNVLVHILLVNILVPTTFSWTGSHFGKLILGKSCRQFQEISTSFTFAVVSILHSFVVHVQSKNLFQLQKFWQVHVNQRFYHWCQQYGSKYTKGSNLDFSKNTRLKYRSTITPLNVDAIFYKYGMVKSSK